jgi:hypothetical protein
VIVIVIENARAMSIVLGYLPLDDLFVDLVDNERTTRHDLESFAFL